MAKFTAHVAVHGDGGTEWFAPGDTIPAWAADRVGDHVTDTPSDATDEPAEPVAQTDPEPAVAPDFTAPRQTRQRRK